jgi:hypothetical protein
LVYVEETFYRAFASVVPEKMFNKQFSMEN